MERRGEHMEGLIRQLLTLPQLQELTAGMDGREKHSTVTGLSPVQRAAVAAAAASQTGRPLLMLCADEQECARQAADLRALTGQEPVVLPARELQLRILASRDLGYIHAGGGAAVRRNGADGAAHRCRVCPRPAGRGRGTVCPAGRYSGYLFARAGQAGAL